MAHCDERIEELKNLKTVADEAGLETEFIDNDRARELWPLMTFDGVKAVLWCHSDGYVQPYDLTMSYAAEGRKLGVGGTDKDDFRRTLPDAFQPEFKIQSAGIVCNSMHQTPTFMLRRSRRITSRQFPLRGP